jgi:hypothetical protein
LGGYGSGRKFFASPKSTVEDSLTLSAYYMQKHGLFRSWTSGSLQWKRRGEVFSSIGYTVGGNRETLTLSYTKTVDGQKEAIETHIRIEKGTTNFGGSRYYFLCPNCRRRYSKLYLAPGAKIFACRKCYDLTYTSCRESHKFDGLYRLIGRNLGASPKEIERALKERWN